MMRLTRRASSLVAFSLLTSAATAHAECTWRRPWQLRFAKRKFSSMAWPSFVR